MSFDITSLFEIKDVDTKNLKKENKKAIIEALLFASDELLLKEDIKKVLPDIDKKIIEEIVDALNMEHDFNNRCFKISSVAGGWRLETKSEFAVYLKKMYTEKKKGRITKPSLETLAVVAYKQPITKTEIEAIRGVNVNEVVNGLLEKGLIKIVGKKDVPGKPVMYATSDKFLEYFGLKTLSDLPKVDEFMEKNTEMV